MAANVPRVAEESEAAASATYAEQVEAAKEQQQQITHPELEGAVRKIQNSLDARVQMIRDDAGIDPTEKRHRIREQYQKASDVHRQVMDRYEAQLDETSAERERALFHVGTREMQDSVRSAYSDLYDRTIYGLGSGETEGVAYAREELERLWERALRTSDRALQVAVGHRATELGMAEIRDAWLATSEEKSKAWGRYVEARTKLDHFKNPQEVAWARMTRGWSLRKPEEA